MSGRSNRALHLRDLLHGALASQQTEQEDGLVIHEPPDTSITTARAADAAATSLPCFPKGETMRQPRISVVVLQKTLLAPVLRR